MQLLCRLQAHLSLPPRPYYGAVPDTFQCPGVDDCDIEEQVLTTDTLRQEELYDPFAVLTGFLRPDLHSTNIDGSEDTNKIVSTINAQSEKYSGVNFHPSEAIEALKQKPQSPDKKIAFWTAYKSLADEFDKEIQEKYKDDLDTSLIFAGLFSAVSSAFIIQIQPELQPDPTEALLALLVQNITGLPLSLLPPRTSTSEPLASSGLFATLMAALLAVLGKQWLLHYNSVGKRGTIAERGLERQPLSIYLWTIHPIIATIALSLTGLGSLLYAGMVISAVLSPDSPFQTSLSFVLKAVLKKFSIPKIPPAPSPEAAAAILVETTAELIPELQWPSNLDFQQAQKRLIERHIWIGIFMFVTEWSIEPLHASGHSGYLIWELQKVRGHQISRPPGFRY
ncbi:hypothetical protein B0H14DRAFT_3176995 [Mycena olivaceomarginata]|nr:hypothetical protein B0H14DRAFT_3176995 [Mycena olivaceomarginata]